MNAHFLLAGILADSQAPNPVTDILLPLVPWVLVFLILLIVLPKIRRQSGQQREQQGRLNQRASEHWDAVERKLDRIIELLETGQDQRKNST
jgi:hypothetical protein